jgi:hypothetical protein
MGIRVLGETAASAGIEDDGDSVEIVHGAGRIEGILRRVVPFQREKAIPIVILDGPGERARSDLRARTEAVDDVEIPLMDRPDRG